MDAALCVLHLLIGNLTAFAEGQVMVSVCLHAENA